MTGRLSPIGGTSSEFEYDNNFNEVYNEKAALLDDYEKLNVSLAALTCHFAQVQLRLQQVISAPTAEDRENLLAELHKYASNGIPDIICQPSILTNEQIIEAQKSREKEFVKELKQKLYELEDYAFTSGSLESAPTLIMVEKQRILIDELRNKLGLKLDDVSVSKLSADELRNLVDQGIHQLTNPVKLKEKLISQMRTEINDLEKFVEFLKADAAKTTTPETTISIPSTATTTTDVSPATRPTTIDMTEPSAMASSADSISSGFRLNYNTLNIFGITKRILVLTQFYALLLLTCGAKSMKTNTYSSNGNAKKDHATRKHFGDARARLEIAIESVTEAVASAENLSDHYRCEDNQTADNMGEYEYNYTNSSAVIAAVRQELAPALLALLEHGLYESNFSSSLSLFGCFSMRGLSYRWTKKEAMHPWKLFLKYYDMKHGDDFTNSPARKLSETFGLDIVGGKPVTLAQFLLASIDAIVKIHQKHTGQMDCYFKSFICYALNEKKLVSFLRLILQTPALVDNCYQSWSYVKQTGFNDALHSLDRLTSIDFQLPINVSVRRFVNNQDLIQ